MTQDTFRRRSIFPELPRVSTREWLIPAALSLGMHACIIVWAALNLMSGGVRGSIANVGTGTSSALLVEYVVVEQQTPATFHQEETAPAQQIKALPVEANAILQVNEQAERTASQSPEEVAVVEPSPEPAHLDSVNPGIEDGSPASNISDTGSNASGDDLTDRYHVALRRHIEIKWQDITKRRIPEGCELKISQQPGGSVLAAVANCRLDEIDRLQLEAVVLMSQPLPYSGFESVFAPDLALQL